jgi:uncharacterized protein (TIGR03435 family)
MLRVLKTAIAGGVLMSLAVVTAAQNHQADGAHEFEVASVKLNQSTDRRTQRQFKVFPAAGRLVITGMTVISVIEGAYDLQSFELVHDANPLLNQRIDIEAKTGGPAASAAQIRRMLQPLLAERFRLAVHRESREMDAFVLTVAAKDGRLGPKMKKSDRACDDLGTGPAPPGERPPCGFLPSRVGRIGGVGLDMPTIINLLNPVGRPIVDNTGLHERYDIDVTYTPQPFSAGTLAQRGGTPMPGVDPNGPSLFNAVEEQLGLKLQGKKMTIPVVVIDHIEPLTEN